MRPALTAPWADVEEWALAEADRKWRDVHGDDPGEWSRLETAGYERLIGRIHRIFADDLGAVAS